MHYVNFSLILILLLTLLFSKFFFFKMTIWRQVIWCLPNMVLVLSLVSVCILWKLISKDGLFLFLLFSYPKYFCFVSGGGCEYSNPYVLIAFRRTVLTKAFQLGKELTTWVKYSTLYHQLWNNVIQKRSSITENVNM